MKTTLKSESKPQRAEILREYGPYPGMDQIHGVTFESDRFVTGVSWVNGELWHATLEAEQSELRRISPETGEVIERFEMPAGVTVSGLDGDGTGVFYCGGATSGKVRAVRKSKP